jgi:hypothetical protein
MRPFLTVSSVSGLDMIHPGVGDTVPQVGQAGRNIHPLIFPHPDYALAGQQFWQLIYACLPHSCLSQMALVPACPDSPMPCKPDSPLIEYTVCHSSPSDSSARHLIIPPHSLCPCPADCENLRDEVPNPQNLDSFTYKIERGNVPFYITDLPNQDRWMVR